MRWTQQFENTTVDLDRVKHAIAMPAFSFYDHASQTMSLTSHEMGVMYCIDRINLFLGWYVLGTEKTLREVYWTIGEAYRYDARLAQATLPVYLDSYFPNLLTDLELYELMPRFEKARVKIRKRFDF
ncbi:hypothetical protein ACFQ4C_12050 [Larkinella insperata]|uniref:Uncharacterized protein n=1 Tax=Larkinella insperata TaxID=332158 RepID=A0ABW3Q5K0_9BACT|nr:hypothetical protein [Larkinella insperata]